MTIWVKSFLFVLVIVCVVIKNCLIEITAYCTFSDVIGITENAKIGSSQKLLDIF